MRLGAWSCNLIKDSIVSKVYKTDAILERHRHRYEVNDGYIHKLEEAGLVISGRSEDGNLVETIEVKDHPWFIACQFHPEFTSTPRNGHRLFTAFVQAANAYKEKG